MTMESQFGMEPQVAEKSQDFDPIPEETESNIMVHTTKSADSFNSKYKQLAKSYDSQMEDGLAFSTRSTLPLNHFYAEVINKIKFR